MGCWVGAVVSSEGRVTTGKVLNAAGPWAGQLAQLNGIDLPLMPLNRQIFLTRPSAPLPRELPLIINTGRGISMRREGADTIGISAVNDDEPSTLVPNVDYDFLPSILPKAVHRLPALADAELVGGYAGIIEHTPDKHSVLDRLPEIDGYFLAFGFSGHGFQHSPIVGQVMAEMILDGGSRSLDATPFALTRLPAGRIAVSDR